MEGAFCPSLHLEKDQMTISFWQKNVPERGRKILKVSSFHSLFEKDPEFDPAHDKIFQSGTPLLEIPFSIPSGIGSAEEKCRSLLWEGPLERWSCASTCLERPSPACHLLESPSEKKCPTSERFF